MAVSAAVRPARGGLLEPFRPDASPGGFSSSRNKRGAGHGHQRGARTGRAALDGIRRRRPPVGAPLRRPGADVQRPRHHRRLGRIDPHHGRGPARDRPGRARRDLRRLDPVAAQTVHGAHPVFPLGGRRPAFLETRPGASGRRRNHPPPRGDVGRRRRARADRLDRPARFPGGQGAGGILRGNGRLLRLVGRCGRPLRTGTPAGRPQLRLLPDRRRAHPGRRHRGALALLRRGRPAGPRLRGNPGRDRRTRARPGDLYRMAGGRMPPPGPRPVHRRRRNPPRGLVFRQGRRADPLVRAAEAGAAARPPAGRRP